jgi:AcrR family transcriptional regulator
MARPQRFRKAIFDSAVRLFGERGWSDTGIRAIAKDAGVSDAALYRHWKGKKALARDIFLDGMAVLHERLCRDVPATGPPGEAIAAIVRTFFEAYDARPEVVRYLLLNQHDVWRTIDRLAPNPVNFWFDFLRSRKSQFHLGDHLCGDVLGPITLGMILRPGIAAAYGSLPGPLAHYSEPVTAAICRVLGLERSPAHA